MQPSEIEELPFYEIEYTIENLTNDIKNRNEQEEEQAQKYDPGAYQSQASKMMKGQQSNYGKSINIPKMPSMPSSPRIPSGGFKMK